MITRPVDRYEMIQKNEYYNDYATEDHVILRDASALPESVLKWHPVLGAPAFSSADHTATPPLPLPRRV